MAGPTRVLDDIDHPFSGTARTERRQALHGRLQSSCRTTRYREAKHLKVIRGTRVSAQTIHTPHYQQELDDE